MLLTPMCENTEQSLKLREVLAKPPRQREVPPVEVGRLVAVLASRQPLDGIAKAVGLRDTGTLRQLIRLTSLPPEVQRLVTWGRQSGKLSFTVASEIARTQSADRQRALTDAAIREGWSKKDVQRALQSG